MAQVFPRTSNTFVWLSLAALGLLVGAGAGLVVGWPWTPYFTGVGQVVAQPVPFSHEHHVAALGLDCRFCHSTVETAGFAGMPATETCMRCHSKVWPEAPLLEPVRQSWRTGIPVQWQRVYKIPEYAYFNHSIHVAKGVGCATCHGAVDAMPLMYKAAPMTMSWCVDCHRNPQKNLRPPEDVFNMAWQPPANQSEVGARLIAENQIPVQRLLDCTTCHR